MRRADRLFDIVQLLRGGRLRTAQKLARQLEVSVRTIYRDIDALVASAVPIEGERGVGYILRDGMLLPPLAFTAIELQALALGVRLVGAWADPELAQAAEELLAKIDDIVQPDRRQELRRQELRAFGLRLDPTARERLATMRRALRARRKLAISYRDPVGIDTRRIVRPLGLEAWGHAWTLTAWCELRDDFRAFRLDRMTAVEALPDGFKPKPGQTMQDYIARLHQKGYQRDPAESTRAGPAE